MISVTVAITLFVTGSYLLFLCDTRNLMMNVLHVKGGRNIPESESDEDAEEGHEEDDHMKSDSEENKDDGEEIDSEQEDRYGR